MKKSFLSDLPLFSGLFSSDRVRIEEISEERVYRKHSYIFEPADFSNEVYFLEKGCVKIGCYSEDGRGVIKNIIHPGEMFGEMGLVGEFNRRDFAKSFNSGVVVHVIKVDVLQKVMRDHPDFSFQLISMIGDRLRRVEQKLESMVFKSSRDRIVDFLRETAEKRGRKVGFEVLLKHNFTHQDIANITGTSRQTVTCVLNNLKRSNIIHIDRKNILFRDLGQLQ